MYIEKLILKNFRNYSKLEINFSPDINFITGENGTGKTNIIEAISITSMLKSFRNIGDSEIIKWGEDSYFCASSVENCSNRTFEIGFANYTDGLKKKSKIDGKEIKKASEFYGKFLTVVFSPVDIDIINGSPDIRRRFFDSVISKIDLKYLEILSEFKRVLLSRNKVLKTIRDKGGNNLSQLEIWNNLFAEKSSFILKRRIEFIELFSDIFRKTYAFISKEKDVPDIIYNSSILGNNFDETYILNKLERYTKRDIAFGSTGIGPQRDDYKIGKSVENLFVNYASQGQKRTASISIKLSECEIIEQKSKKKCVIMVDDIFSELDSNRRKNMVNLLRRENQVIFTMVNREFLNKNKFSNFKEFLVEKEGNVIEI